MKKMNLFALMSLLLGICVLPLEGATDSSTPSQNIQSSSKTGPSGSHADEEDDEYDIMERDEIDDTDTYAIPFDDSEIEDEEEINQAEKKEVFPIPHAR